MTKSLAEHIETFDRALTANEVAKLLAVRRDTIYANVKACALPAINIGKSKTMLRFDPGELAEWVRERQSFIVLDPRPTYPLRTK